MSRVDEVVKQYKAQIDAAHERERGAAGVSDDSDVLDLVESMAVDSVKALLDDLDEAPRPQEPAETTFERASEAIVSKPDRFVKDAPVKFLAHSVLGLNQVLRDIGYLRQGFGLGSDDPRPSDMKWNHSSSVESYVWDSLSRLVESIKPETGEIHRLIPEVEVDLASTHRGIVELLDQDLGPAEFMDAVIDLGESQTKVAGWDVFSDLSYEDELKERSSFFLDVITRQPPTAPLIGLYAEIAYPSRRGETVADLDLMGCDSYQPDSEEWFGLINYWPKDAYASSDVLASIYRMAYAPGGLGNAADYTLCLAWGAYFARVCARHYVSEVGSARVGVRVGFSGGDWIELGWLDLP